MVSQYRGNGRGNAGPDIVVEIIAETEPEVVVEIIAEAEQREW